MATNMRAVLAHGFLKFLMLPSKVSPSVWYTTLDAIEESVPKISSPAMLTTEDACTMLATGRIKNNAQEPQVYL